MQKDNLHEPFELVLKEFMDVCPRGEHTHTFFELVYIVSGNGIQSINDVELPYATGDLFLVAPNDTHFFKIDEITQFFFIRFNSSYVRSSKNDNELVGQLELILRNAGNDPGSIIQQQADRQAIKQLMDMIIREHLEHDVYHKQLIMQLVNTVLVMIARNISRAFPEGIDEASDNKAIEILRYIQSNIYFPEKLKAANISSGLGISETYLGRFFKKHTGETLQQYILNYKMQLVKNRLLYSGMRISEIAYEFGFTDKSHLNRTFRKYVGANPSMFRKAYKESNA